MKDWSEFLEEAKKHIPEKIECEIKMISSVSSLTRFANSHIHQNVEEEVGEIYLTIHKNGKTITLNSNITSIDSPKSFIEKALMDVDNSPEDQGWAGIPEKELSYSGYQEFESKNPEERAEKVREFIEAGKDLNAAGYCSTSVDNYFVWNTNGLESSDSTTSAFIDGSVVGSVFASEYLELKSKANIMGDVNYASMEIHLGAIISGNLIHNENNLEEKGEKVEY